MQCNHAFEMKIGEWETMSEKEWRESSCNANKYSIHIDIWCGVDSAHATKNPYSRSNTHTNTYTPHRPVCLARGKTIYSDVNVWMGSEAFDVENMCAAGRTMRHTPTPGEWNKQWVSELTNELSGKVNDGVLDFDSLRTRRINR